MVRIIGELGAILDTWDYTALISFFVYSKDII